MHAVKIPFSGIENLSICPPQKTFLSQKPFFFKTEPLKKTFFYKVELTACNVHNTFSTPVTFSQKALITLSVYFHESNV